MNRSPFLRLSQTAAFLCRLALCVALVLTCAASTAEAQRGSGKRTPYSESEKIGFAFYRLADRPPPFENWIKRSDGYLLAKPSAKRAYLNNEMERLTKAYAEYMPDDDLIYIRTVVRVTVPPGSERAAYEKMGVRKPIQILMDDVKENYFPVQVGEMWIAVVPDRIEEFLFLSLDETDYKIITSRLGLDAQGLQRPATLEMRLRPTSIDLTRPLPLDGLDAWLMMGEIATISLWRKSTDGKNALVWEKSMDWYTPQQQKELLDLYSR